MDCNINFVTEILKNKIQQLLTRAYRNHLADIHLVYDAILTDIMHLKGRGDVVTGQIIVIVCSCRDHVTVICGHFL